MAYSVNETNPYWVFEESRHFWPKINKGDYYRQSGYDFGALLVTPIFEFMHFMTDEIDGGHCLSYTQKTLYYWWRLDAQVNNGGFVQFYYNGYGVTVPALISGLNYVGDKKMSS